MGIAATLAIMEGTQHGEAGGTGGKPIGDGGTMENLCFGNGVNAVGDSCPGDAVLGPGTGEKEPMQNDPEGRQHVFEPAGGE